MPASPIEKEITLPDNWEQLEKTMIPDQATACYWSVWYNAKAGCRVGTASLMWCAMGDDPSVNDSWGNAEEIDGDCKNALDVIESVHGVSFHECMWVQMGASEVFPAMGIDDLTPE